VTDRKQNLLFNIQQHHKRIGNVLVRKRVQTYHIQNNTANHANILNALSNYLDMLRASYVVNQQSTELHTTFITANTTSQNPAAPEQSTMDSSSTLAHHFKANGAPSSLQPYISENLKVCIMDNIHASIRYARLRSRTNTELHTEIARHALLEPGCCLPVDECITFIIKMQEAINPCATCINTNFRSEIAVNKH
jgi:hypothetical protein